MGTLRVIPCNDPHGSRPISKDHVRRESDKFRRVFAIALTIARAPPIVDACIAPYVPSQFGEPLQEGGVAGLGFGIVGDKVHEHPNAPHALCMLRARRERPRRRAAEQRNEFTSPHSITSSARARSVGGTVRPSIRAVEALMTNLNLLDCITGRSTGLAPLRMRPAYSAERIDVGLRIPQQATSCGVYATIIYYFTIAIMRDRFLAPVTQGQNVRGPHEYPDS